MATQEEEWAQHLGVADIRGAVVSHLFLVAEQRREMQEMCKGVKRKQLKQSTCQRAMMDEGLQVPYAPCSFFFETEWKI